MIKIFLVADTYNNPTKLLMLRGQMHPSFIYELYSTCYKLTSEELEYRDRHHTHFSVIKLDDDKIKSIDERL